MLQQASCLPSMSAQHFTLTVWQATQVSSVLASRYALSAALMYGVIQLTGSGAINCSSGCRWVVGATQEAAEQQAEKQFPGKHFTLVQVGSEILFTRTPPFLAGSLL